MMKIAIPSKNGQIDPALSRATEFTFVTVSDDCKSFEKQLLPARGEGHISVVDLLATEQAGVLICGELGVMACSALSLMDMTLVPGCKGSVDDALDKFLKGEAQGDPSVLAVDIEMDENDPLRCMHDCAQCGGCGDPNLFEVLKKQELLPEV